MSKLTLTEAAAEVFRKDPRTKINENQWLYFVSVLRELGFSIQINFSRKMPSPESILKVKRDILNKPENKERFGDIRGGFIPEENVSYEQPAKH